MIISHDCAVKIKDEAEVSKPVNIIKSPKTEEGRKRVCRGRQCLFFIGRSTTDEKLDKPHRCV